MLSLMKLDFYKLISDNESFIPLNLPKRTDVNSDLVSTLGEVLEDKHPLISKLCNLVGRPAGGDISSFDALLGVECAWPTSSLRWTATRRLPG